MAHKVPKTVSPRILWILMACGLLNLLSVLYLLDAFHFGRPIPGWVLVAAAGALAMGIALLIAVTTVPSLRDQLAVLRSRVRAMPAARRSSARRYSFLIGTVGAVVPYLIWFLIPRGADFSRPPEYDLAVFAFAALEAALLVRLIQAISRD